MKNRRRKERRKIPEALGNRACSVWLYVLVLVFDASAHGLLLYSYGFSFYTFLHLFLSFIFFIYPLYYLADILWSLRPSVCGILSGEIAVNRKYYMNTVRREVSREDLLPVTINIPVYLENNEVIFQTVRDALAAAERYRSFSGAAANVVVSDDGIAPLLQGCCDTGTADLLLNSLTCASAAAKKLSEKEEKAAERIRFYRENGAAFVVRPAQNRPGLFKKASNMNYTLRLSKAVSEGGSLGTLTGKGGAFEKGYAEGDFHIHDIILLLDKDSGVKERIIEAVVPEFGHDRKLAYVQCATVARNLRENYYTYATGHQINNLFHNIWPCKALQGFFVPLVGHNVFIKKSLLEKSGLWSEDRVSEDYDKAISFYCSGFHGKYAQLRGLEFEESASRTFTEETRKQHRYSYGLFEMIFDGTVFSKRMRGCDRLYMLMYFCSVINMVLLLPTVLTESYFGNIHLLWAGFLLCMACFIIPPLLRDLVMRRRIPDEILQTVPYTLVIAVSFVGHSYSFLSGGCRYLANKIKKITAPFPSTSVDDLDYCFRGGLRILFDYIRKNILFLPIAFMCVDRGVFLITRKGLEPVTTLTYGYILFCAVFVPVLLTPQLFAGPLRKKTAAGIPEVEGMKQKTGGMPESSRGAAFYGSERILSPVIIEQDETQSTTGSDIEQFLADYQESLKALLPEADIPERLLADYEIESCIRKDPEGRKELYILRRRLDGKPAFLRVTKDYAEEDALEEAFLLDRLDHPGIPKVFDAFEQNGKRCLVREYVEGRTLYDIVSEKGVLSTEDILGIALKLGEILQYLHNQTPPVIHRDIKPQNIVVGKDGSIHLIDFGIAREHKLRRRQDTAVVLTLDYASPEQYGFEQTTPLSDIYSLGVVLLYLATGRTVRVDLEAQIVNNRLRELIEQCIAFNPKARIQSAEQICAYIRRDDSRNVRRRRYRMAAAGITAAALILAAASFQAGYMVESADIRTGSYDRGYSAGYTDGYDSRPVFRRTENTQTDLPEGTVSENMAVPGGAFAAENDGLIFYIADGGIWSMSANGTDAELLVEDSKAQSISCANGWIYYTSGDDICQSAVYEDRKDVLTKEKDGRLYTAEDRFYILTENGLSLLDPKTGKKSAVKALSDCIALYTDENYLYFISGSKQGLYRCEYDGKHVEKLLDDSCQSICRSGDDLICSVEKDGAASLVLLNTETKETQLLLETKAAMLNRAENSICYLDLSNNAIMCCSPDGRIRERVSANRAADLNVAGGWIFYHNEGDDGRLWCVRTDGSNDHPLPSGR